MLRITMNKSAGGAKKYYCEAYYKEGRSAQMDYYSEKEQAIGRWGGLAAEQLGLTGDISKQDFAALCDNINPITGKSLTGRNDADRRVGYDFTFNASKSVSLAYAFANEADKKEILTAFQQSVRETMTEIESGMQARVRAGGKNENRITGNIAFGEFTHFTTRPIDGVPDPHLHSHCFVFNATYDGVENKWKAGEFQQVKQDAPYYEAVFHSKLANNLQDLGFKIQKTDNGFELVGVEKKTIDKFSRRTKEIEDYSKEHNITDDKQKEKVGAKTREAKRIEVSPEQQETAWQNRLDANELANVQNLKQRSAKFPADTTPQMSAQEALQFSLDHHLERKSVASDKEILATAIKSSVGKTTPELVKKAFDKDSNILVAEEKLRTFITTKEALKEERQLIINVTETKNKFRPINEHYEPKNQQLNEQQQAAVKHALSSTDGLVIITGRAGTGKTTLMKEVQQGILESGKQIYSFAPSSEASRIVQRSEGFTNAETVAKLIQDKKLQSELKHQVLWVDEAGMLSNKDMNQILAIAKEQSARVILSGDTKQHNSVQRGDALRIIQDEAQIKPITVSKIQRQKNSEYREAVKMLSAGSVEKGFKKLENIGAIHEITDNQDRVKAVAEDYYHCAYAGENQPAKEVLVIAPTHTEGEVVTNQIRQKLKEKEILGNDEKEIKVLKNLQLTEAEKQNLETYQQGNVIVFFQNVKGVKAGNKLEVTGIEGGSLRAKDAGGMSYTVPIKEAQKFSVFETKEIKVTKGDKIRITANSKSNDGKNLFNGTTFSIDGFDKQGNIKLSNGSTISKDFGYFNFGYVTTSHSSQGKTADKVIISQSSATFRASSMEQFYVSVSRGKQAVSIYTDDKEHLKQAITQSVQRISATELMSKMQKQVQEINRVSTFRKWQEKAAETYDKIISKIRNNGLQTTIRREQREAR